MLCGEIARGLEDMSRVHQLSILSVLYTAEIVVICIILTVIFCVLIRFIFKIFRNIYHTLLIYNYV